VSFLDPFGIFDGGGGGSSASVTTTTNLNINGLDDLKSTVELKPVEVKPFTVNENVDLKPIEVKPLTVNSNVDLKPVTVSETFDLRPVAVDACQTLRLAPLPETDVCQPYRHHVGWTVFGIELVGMVYDGESQQLVRSPRRAQVVGPQGTVSHRPAVGPAGGGRGLHVRVVQPDDE
jgi:hypothetical protein